MLYSKQVCVDCKKMYCVCKEVLIKCNLEPHKCYFRNCTNEPNYFHKNGNLCYFHKNEFLKHEKKLIRLVFNAIKMKNPILNKIKLESYQLYILYFLCNASTSIFLFLDLYCGP